MTPPSTAEQQSERLLGYARSLGRGLLGVPASAPAAPRQPSRPSTAPMAYLLPFEIVSVHLLVVLIGAAYLARAKRRRGALPA